MDKKVQDILSKMTLEDKISLCNGADFWHSKAMAQYGIPAVTMSDGPHGVRCQKNGADMLGVNESEPATCFPTAVTSGATWDAALLKAEGQASPKPLCAATRASTMSTPATTTGC